MELVSLPPVNSPLPCDIVIFGGGATGLWLLDELVRTGCHALLLEAHDLGSGQTVASQGIIHGGLKYTLGGFFTASAKAIAEMPLIWRRSLAGEAQPDLSGTRMRSEFCYLWRTASFRSRLAMIGAQTGLKIAPKKLTANERPGVLANCPGTVARLDEQVIEPSSFIAQIANRHPQRIYKIDTNSGVEFEHDHHTHVSLIRLINPETGDPLDITAATIMFTAGEGNALLRKKVGLPETDMQRRPLHMVMVRGRNLPPLNGHCVDGMATRMTITSTHDYSDRPVWQIGGQVAERGVQMSPNELIEFAQQELKAVIPGFVIRNLEWATYRVDRAEPATHGGNRPDDAYAVRQGNVVTAWPTKLALVPEVVRRIRELINDAKPPATADLRQAAETRTMARYFRDWPRPVVALPPWETCEQWRLVD